MTVAAQVQTRPFRVNLSGQRALVTGAGRGIGRGIALGLAESGADGAVVARTACEVERTVTEIRTLGRTGLARTGDSRDSAPIEPELTAGVAQNPAVYNALSEKTSMGRLVVVDEVVGTALYLVCDAAAYVTGHTVYLDGGWLTQ